MVLFISYKERIVFFLFLISTLPINSIIDVRPFTGEVAAVSQPVQGRREVDDRCLRDVSYRI